MTAVGGDNEGQAVTAGPGCVTAVVSVPRVGPGPVSTYQKLNAKVQN